MRASTWKQFKEEVEAQGITDDAELRDVDYDPDSTFSGVEVYRDVDGKWVIQNETF